MFAPSRPLALTATAALLATVAACDSQGSGAALTSTTVKAGDHSCTVGLHELPTGTVRLDISNVGSERTEVALYGEGDAGGLTDAKAVKKDIGPGLSQQVTVDLDTGQYRLVCTPRTTRRGTHTDLRVVSDENDSVGGHDRTRPDRTVHVQVAADGTVTAPPTLKAGRGDELMFDVENQDDADYALEVTSPEGKELTSVELPAKQHSEGLVDLSEGGGYRVRVHESGHPGQGTEVPLQVAP